MVGWVGPRTEGPFPRGFRPPGSPWGWLRGEATGFSQAVRQFDVDLRLVRDSPMFASREHITIVQMRSCRSRTLSPARPVGNQA